MQDCLILKKSNCKNCYKCIRHCPVKSIRFSGSRALIDPEECVLCGHCFVECPQDAREIRDETESVRVLLQSGSPVIASIAPSFIAYYDGVGIESMREGLKKLGFYDVEETAIGATIVKKEYERILKEGSQDVVISSCCHSVNLLIQKYFPLLLPALADVLTPAEAHSREIRRRIPDAKIVFIGPCIAKIDESQRSGFVDAVLTFDALERWLGSRKISLSKSVIPSSKSKARFFPTTGGILKTMDLSAENYTYAAVDGVKQCIAALHDIEKGRVHHCFIEMSACTGSCCGGPVMQRHRKSSIASNLAILHYAGNEDFDVPQPDSLRLKTHFSPMISRLPMPTEEEISDILHQMGKFKPSDELNCGTCGYNTCRDKAVAVFQGKAEISMCLPFLKEKAESFTDTIVKNTPNGLVVLNEKLEVQQINPAAQIIMNIRNSSDVQGMPVNRILDPKPFADVLETEVGRYNKRVYLAEYRRYVDQTIVYDRSSHTLVCIMRDVSEEQVARDKKEKITRETVEVADRVVDKQMRIVQEIASLLGETAAETKIALAKLKESVTDE